MSWKLRIIVFTALVGTVCLGASARASQHPTGSARTRGATVNACTVPHRYIELINSGKYRLIGPLFSQNAVYNGPDGKTRVGARSIGGFYTRFLGKLRPKLRAASYIREGDNCIQEMEERDSKTHKWILFAVDHWVVNREGKAVEFTVYFRPDSSYAPKIAQALKK